MNASIAPEESFAVAFSLVGEHRHVVRPIAEKVAQEVGGQSKVFYDEWHEQLIGGFDADLRLGRIYTCGAELIVVCVSGRYGGKPWTVVEYRAIRARVRHGVMADKDDKSIMLIRVGEGEIEGVVLPLDIAHDVRNWPPERAAELIIGRLNEVRKVADSLAWPRINPTDLHWPVADHSEARAAFAALLTIESPVQALLICGPPQTGKTHMSTRMLYHAQALHGIRSGRFDLKGTAGLDLEIQEFAGCLDVAVPFGGSLSERLGRIIDQLRQKSQPTVLIFDSCESAGEVGIWLERVLPTRVRSVDWLRVVVVGRSVPKRIGTMWQSISAPVLAIETPAVQHWIEYCRLNHGDAVAPDFVVQAYELVNGSPVHLQALFGPQGG